MLFSCKILIISGLLQQVGGREGGEKGVKAGEGRALGKPERPLCRAAGGRGGVLWTTSRILQVGESRLGRRWSGRHFGAWRSKPH